MARLPKFFDPDLAFLNEVSSVPWQQALRHQHKGFSAFFAKRARYPRFKSRSSRQSAHYTRSAFSCGAGGRHSGASRCGRP
jgi:putative transposase